MGVVVVVVVVVGVGVGVRARVSDGNRVSNGSDISTDVQDGTWPGRGCDLVVVTCEAMESGWVGRSEAGVRLLVGCASGSGARYPLPRYVTDVT